MSVPLSFGAEIDALLADPARDLLVLTDKYPPDHVGGAEVSLSLVLGQPAFRDRVVTALFDPDATTPRLYRHAGVPVAALPDAAPWPLQRRAAADWAAARRRGRAARAAFEIGEGARLLAFGGPPRELPDRAAALWFELGRRPRGGIAADFTLAPGAGWLRARVAAALVARMRPQATLLDNCRSVLLADALRAAHPGLRIVAMVRDNRFHCARYDQSVSVSGVRCGACSFDCAREDAGRGFLRAAAHRRHLRLSAARRRAALGAADLVAVTSRYLETAVGPLVAPGRLRRIPNPAGDAETAAEAIRGVAEAPGAHLVIVGMLNEAKGQLPFLEAAAPWLRADPARVVHLAGRGERMAARIRAFADAAGIADRVVLHGFLARAEVLALMRACHVVAAPTIWPEPFGRVPLEAGLARRPTVAFAQGGLAESILDGETGYLVPPGDYAAFLARIERLVADPALRMRMGTAATLHVGAVFSVQRSAALLAEALIGPDAAQSLATASSAPVRQAPRS